MTEAEVRHLQALIRRRDFLTSLAPDRLNPYARRELAALDWALGQLAQLVPSNPTGPTS